MAPPRPISIVAWCRAATSSADIASTRSNALPFPIPNENSLAYLARFLCLLLSAAVSFSSRPSRTVPVETQGCRRARGGREGGGDEEGGRGGGKSEHGEGQVDAAVDRHGPLVGPLVRS